MQRNMVVEAIIWRMIAWGTTGGAIAGAFYAMVVFTVAGSSYLSLPVGTVGLIIGGIVGFGLGLVNGCVLAGITHIALPKGISPTRYRVVMIGASTLLTGAGGLLGFSGFTASLGLADAWLVYTLIPTLIAVVVAVIATVRVAQWVENITASSLRVE